MRVETASATLGRHRAGQESGLGVFEGRSRASASTARRVRLHWRAVLDEANSNCWLSELTDQLEPPPHRAGNLESVCAQAHRRTTREARPAGAAMRPPTVNY